MNKKSVKEAAKDIENKEIGKLLTKGSNEFKSFIKFLKHNASKDSKRVLLVDYWALCSKTQLESLKEKPKTLKAKYFEDEKSFLELAKTHKKYSDVGGVRHFHRFVDFTECELAKDTPKADYMTEFLTQKPEKEKSEKPKISKLEKPEKPEESKKAEKDKTDSAKSSKSKTEEAKKDAPFAKSAKVFDDEVYTILGSLETAKINYIKGEMSNLKEQMFTTERQLEGVHNVLFMALSKLGLVDPNAKSPFQKEIKELWYSDAAMEKLKMKMMQKHSVSRIIDELNGKEAKSSGPLSYDDDENDRNDYELFEHESRSGTHDHLGKQIRQKERKSKKRQDVR